MVNSGTITIPGFLFCGLRINRTAFNWLRVVAGLGRLPWEAATYLLAQVVDIRHGRNRTSIAAVRLFGFITIGTEVVGGPFFQLFHQKLATAY